MTTSTDLGAALVAFIHEHEYCGELDGGAEGDRGWMTCTCGAVINRHRSGLIGSSAVLVRVAPFR